MKNSANPTLGQVTPQELAKARDAGTIIIDIRREDEWQKTGIIDAAHTITGLTKTGELHPEFKEKFTTLVPDKNTPFIIYCHGGVRSDTLGRSLIEQLCYTQVSHLTCGIIGWIDCGASIEDARTADLHI